ncbi:MAG: HigA family addiction module antidote protein [Treponema sp.]|jgi:addiction module HigA family antidote|nr:HigA family addiction module antidote protein [Treponema sp.]
MAKSNQTPGSVLISLMDKYQLNPYSLAKKINLSASAVRQIAIGQSAISIPTALRLGKFFGPSPDFWLDLQRKADYLEAGKNKKLQGILKGISKVQKPKAPQKGKIAGKTAAKPARRKAKK